MFDYEVKPGLPPYGPEARPFSSTGMGTHSEGFVVEFRVGSIAWTGNFQPGSNTFNGVIRHPDGQHAIVLAGGVGYLLDPMQPEAWTHFGWGITFAKALPELKAVVIANDLWLELLGARGIVWQTHRISWDEMKELVIRDTALTGYASGLDNDWYHFKVNLLDGTVSGGSYTGPDTPLELPENAPE